MRLRRITMVTIIAAFLAAGMIAQTATAQVPLPGTASWSDPAFLIMPAKSELGLNGDRMQLGYIPRHPSGSFLRHLCRCRCADRILSK